MSLPLRALLGHSRIRGGRKRYSGEGPWNSRSPIKISRVENAEGGTQLRYNARNPGRTGYRPRAAYKYIYTYRIFRRSGCLPSSNIKLKLDQKKKRGQGDSGGGCREWCIRSNYLHRVRVTDVAIWTETFSGEYRVLNLERCV